MPNTNVLLIDSNDIKTYRPTAKLDDERIMPFVREVQDTDLRPLLTEALYHDFITKFQTTGDAMYAAYQKLLVGGTYTYNSNTIQYDGLKPFLCYLVLAKVVVENPLHISRFGIVRKTSEFSEPIDPAESKAVINELRSTARIYETRINKYLNENLSTYPLYSSAQVDRVNAPSFNFFKL